MNSLYFRLLLGAGMAATWTVSPAAPVKGEVVHILAKQTLLLGSKGIAIPQLYVVAGDGSMILEGKSGATQAFGPIVDALGKPTKPATKPEVAAIVKILQSQGVTFRPTDKPTVVSLEAGQTVGLCNACTDYYPRLQGQLQAMNRDVRWIRVNIEKNDYPLKSAK